MNWLSSHRFAFRAEMIRMTLPAVLRQRDVVVLADALEHEGFIQDLDSHGSFLRISALAVSHLTN